MGLIDKIKNALFEEEYVEVEEKPKKPRKETPKSSRDFEPPIAKKVVLPEKRDIKDEDLDEDELIDEDFVITPQNETVVPEKKSFKVMDEDDFKVEEDNSYHQSEPQIVRVIDKEEEVVKPEVHYYGGKPENKEKHAYGINNSNKINMPEYGNNKAAYDSAPKYNGIYEKKDDRTYFRASPIISPIYGILDKNYKKEDVVSKKEVRLTSSYARENLSVEEVREKAYGNLSDDIEKEMDKDIENSFQIEEKALKDNNSNNSLLVDLSTEKDKPAVKEVTMGDALEYFEDLGLEYNVDYVDANKPAPTSRRTKENYDEVDRTVPSNTVENKDDKSQNLNTIIKEQVDNPEKAKADIDSSDDNLFDLIDSMYKEND